MEKQGNGAADQASSSFEMGILAFGTSVSVTDEVRRSVEKETEVIEESIKQVRGKMKIEEKVGEELRRNRVSGLKETRDILQGSTENLNSLHFTVDFLQELEKTFITELVDPSTRPLRKDASGDEMMENESPSGCGISIVNIKAEIMEQQRELDALHEEGISQVNSISLIKEKKIALMEAMETLQQRRKDDRLEEQNDELDKKINQAKQEHENELKRRNSLVGSLEEAKKRTEALENEKRKLVSNFPRCQILQRDSSDVSSFFQQLTELDENSVAFQSEKEDIENSRLRMEKEKCEKETILQCLTSETTSNANRITKLKEQLEEAKKLIDLREELKRNREAARATRLELHSEKEALENELATTKDIAAQAKIEALKIEESMLEVDVLRRQNDENQEKQVLPGEREHDSLLQQETELKSLIREVQNDPAQIELKSTIDKLQQRLNDVLKECTDFSAEFEKKRKEMEEQDDVVKQRTHSTTAEIEMLRAEVSAVQQNNAEVEDSISQLDRKIQEKSGGKELEMLKQKLRIFQSGARLLKTTAKNEKDILNLGSDHFG